MIMVNYRYHLQVHIGKSEIVAYSLIWLLAQYSRALGIMI